MKFSTFNRNTYKKRCENNKYLWISNRYSIPIPINYLLKSMGIKEKWENDISKGKGNNKFCCMNSIREIITLVFNRLIDQVGRVFASGPGDRGSIPGRVVPKTLKMVLDISLLNTQQYKVRIEGKVEQSREKSSTLP